MSIQMWQELQNLQAKVAQMEAALKASADVSALQRRISELEAWVRSHTPTKPKQ